MLSCYLFGKTVKIDTETEKSEFVHLDPLKVVVRDGSKDSSSR